MKEDRKIPLLPVLAIAIVCISVVAIAYTYSSGVSEKKIEWDLTLIGDKEMILTFDEITKMSPYDGKGGFFTTVGIVNGPFVCSGVPVEELCDLVGGIDSSKMVWVSAPDGYLMVFTFDDIRGGFITYDPATMKEVPHGKQKVILMYEQDGTILNNETGGPLRLAIAGSDALLTEGHYWVQSVDKIEIK